MAFRSSQVAEFLDMNMRSLRHWTSEGKIKAKKDLKGRHWLYEKEDLAKFILSDHILCKKFLAHIPKKQYANSYNILLQEVRRQYAKLCEDNS